MRYLYQFWCAHDYLDANIATCARSGFDDKGLTKPLLQPLADQTREDVRCTAGRSGDNHTDWSASGTLGLARSASRPAMRQRPRPDAENFGGEVSRCPPGSSLFCGTAYAMTDTEGFDPSGTRCLDSCKEVPQSKTNGTVPSDKV